MLQSSSPAVSYEAAWTLVSLSSAPTAVRAAASTYASLLNSQSDNNVKLIILERLSDLKQRHTRVRTRPSQHAVPRPANTHLSPIRCPPSAGRLPPVAWPVLTLLSLPLARALRWCRRC